jgi:hypothetical protein
MWGEHYATTLFNSSYFTVDDTIHFLKKVCYKFKEKNIEPSWFHGPSHEFFLRLNINLKKKILNLVEFMVWVMVLTS